MFPDGGVIPSRYQGNTKNTENFSVAYQRVTHTVLV